MQKQTIVILIGIMVISQFVYGQSGAFQWAVSVEGSGYNEGHSIVTDVSGNAYVTGYFRDTADFDPGQGKHELISNGEQDIFISKLDIDGQLIWVKHIGGSTQDEGYAIAVDELNNTYTTGAFSGPVDFDPDTGTFILNGYGGFICKLDSSGSFLWALKTPVGAGNSIKLDNSGNVLTTGGWNTYILKVNTNGQQIWSKQFSGSATNQGNSIIIDNSDNILMTGYFSDSLDCNPDTGTYNLISEGANDIYISKLDSSGGFIWAKQIGGSLADEGKSLTTDALGNVYLTGHFKGTVDFDPGSGEYEMTTASTLESNMFVCKLDKNGQFVWAIQIGTSGSSEGRFITSDSTGNLYVLGTYKGVLIAKIGTDGDILWEQYIESINGIWGNSLALDEFGNIHTIGAFQILADFDPGPNKYTLSTDRSPDVFIQKMNGTVVGIVENNHPLEFTVYPNPSCGELNIDLRQSYEKSIIRIRDVTGRIVSSSTYFSSRLVSINIPGSAGIYLLEINVGEHRPMLLKVVKK